MNRICKQCNLEKNILNFRHQTKGCKVHIGLVCKKCDYENGKSRHKKFREAHRNELKLINKEYYAQNKDEIKERQKDKKPIWDKVYYEKNKKKIQKIQQRRIKERYQIDPNFRIRKVVSKSIHRTLTMLGGSKSGQSCLKFLGYTMQDLREYIEKRFEPWMTWENYGKYNAKKWNDYDQMTWTWQIDHIIPQSDLLYVSMEDDNFKKCWALENLRPLSAKQNWFDGISKARHQKKVA